MADFQKLTDDLKRMRDEIRLKIHLGSKEAQQEWADLETRWQAFSEKADLKRTAGQLNTTVKQLGSDLKSARVYHVIPRIVGQQSSLELFLEGREEKLSSSVEVETLEAWAQLTFPLTERTQNRPYVRFQKPKVKIEDGGEDERYEEPEVPG